MTQRSFAGLVLLALAILLLGTCSMNTPTHYARIIIDTYLPNTGLVQTPDIDISLYGSSGEAAAAIVTGTYVTMPNPDMTLGYTRIDYTGGLDAGKYYIKLNGDLTTDNGAYAIRILTSLPVPPYDTPPGSPPDFFPGQNLSDAPYEPDDVVSNGVPTNPVAIKIGDRLNRFLGPAVGDVDWFVLNLP